MINNVLFLYIVIKCLSIFLRVKSIFKNLETKSFTIVLRKRSGKKTEEKIVFH